MVPQYTETVLEGNTKLDITRERDFVQNIPMGYLDRLAVLRKRAGLSQDDLGERMGVAQATIQRWESGNREPKFEQLFRLAEELGVSVGELLNTDLMLPVGPKLYVKGEVAAGVWKAALEKPEDEWETFFGRSDVTALAAHRFGLRIVGDSMDMLYPEGAIVECVSVFGHTEPEPGKRVVVLRTNEQNEVEATVKELVEQEGELWLVPRSYNPAHLPAKLSEPGDGIVEIRIAATVVGSYKPE